MKKALIIRHPDRHGGPAWHGVLGHCRQAATPEALGDRGFTGLEGLTAEGERTGWGEPVRWMSGEVLASRLEAIAWKGEEGDDFAWWAKQFLFTPSDFKGLREHYPEVYDAF